MPRVSRWSAGDSILEGPRQQRPAWAKAHRTVMVKQLLAAMPAAWCLVIVVSGCGGSAQDQTRTTASSRANQQFIFGTPAADRLARQTAEAEGWTFRSQHVNGPVDTGDVLVPFVMSATVFFESADRKERRALAWTWLYDGDLGRWFIVSYRVREIDVTRGIPFGPIRLEWHLWRQP